MHNAEPNEYRLRFGVRLPLAFLLGLGPFPPIAYDRRENLDAFLAALHETAEFPPCAISGDAHSRGPLTRNGNDIAEAVIVEPRHR